MAEESVTTKMRVDDEIFEIPEGIGKREALSFADIAIEMSKSLMSAVVRDEQDQPDFA